jgi:hypothetical protein
MKGMPQHVDLTGFAQVAGCVEREQRSDLGVESLLDNTHRLRTQFCHFNSVV